MVRDLIRIGAVLALSSIVLGNPGIARVAEAADGQMTWAVHVTIAPRWLDLGDAESAITPFMVLYALHEALVKPMPAGLDDAESCRVVDRLSRLEDLRLGAEERGQVSQR